VHLPNRAASLAQRGCSGARFFPPKCKATVMNISDIRTRIESCEKSALVTRTAEPDETPVLKLVDPAEQSESDAESSEMPDPLIQALVKKLPKPNSIWSIDDRAKWLRAASIIFNLVYKPGEGNETELKIQEKAEVMKSAG
jgi:hypothetical protein